MSNDSFDILYFWDFTRFHFCFSGSGNSAPTSEYLPDRPIGYGAFGVVWSVTDPRDSKRVALKKLPNVFQSLVSSKRVFRELKMMRFFRHENVLSCLDILQVSMINIKIVKKFVKKFVKWQGPYSVLCDFTRFYLFLKMMRVFRHENVLSFR